MYIIIMNMNSVEFSLLFRSYSLAMMIMRKNIKNFFLRINPENTHLHIKNTVAVIFMKTIFIIFKR